MTPGLQGAENGPMSAYFPDHPLIPKNTCPEGAKTPRVKLIGEVGPLPPFLAWTIINVEFAEKDGWKGDIIFYQSKKFWNEQMIH